ncbi:MAG: aromatic amino acid lyase [Deltaproteobacteria bacterium]|nr:aromatic amino acid lyase [Deltaproteobacteria bacterium]
MTNQKTNQNVIIGKNSITIDDVINVAIKNKSLELSYEDDFVKRIRAGREALDALQAKGEVVYGVSTGVGDSCVREVESVHADLFATNLMRFHGCGLGDYFDVATCRAVLVIRLESLKTGFSAVRFELLEMLAMLLERDIIPRIPKEGSVGASGDLTPLSYVAAVIMGERDVYYKGNVRVVNELFEELNIKPFMLKAKEALAIMNGTAVMTAVACFAYKRAENIVRLGASLTAMLTEALKLNKGHFDERIFLQKPHPGQLEVGKQIAREIGYTKDYRLEKGERIQATYAIRCVPHILGVLADALKWIKPFIETEINSVNDNPLIDPDNGDVLHGGNFYGGHISFAMDSLKNAIANCADLFDRQMALLVNERSNNGLVSNLSGAPAEVASVHHGFKAVHIATSAFAAEALKNTMPASVFSRSTESHNQDKVSMGTISARDAVRVLELTEQTLAATFLGAVQALDLREKSGEIDFNNLQPEVLEIYKKIRKISKFVEMDRPLDQELRSLIEIIKTGEL